MSGGDDLLRPLRLELARRGAEVLRRALAIDPPGHLPPSWKALLDDLGVAPLSEDRRFASIQRDRFHKGAPSEEVAACLERIVAGARRELTVSTGIPTSIVSEVEALLDDMAGATLERYRQEAQRAPAGGMFAFAMATAQAKKTQGAIGAGRYALHCPDCGAVRLHPENLICEYCGGKTSLA